ncbi:XRE family transcriptional regulator [Neptunitalea lumnitzerae]|uniref:HTH cro/C1-type domain-containing protein n=1 Tax=Neptunitalea lumnitzerae TaxID=2965509 RepID=A0ABQ5MEJ8_9FLAO|nr:XRE family transcriptional regulator [Neptunitalea sp. Y10]GLB47821.1 hypothetical protein Y10_01890 [Neptunitalea sp. Y10]
MLKIKELRKEKKESQSDLAEVLGVSLRTIQNYEAGKVAVPYKNLELIAQHYGVTVAQFFTNEQEEKAIAGVGETTDVRKAHHELIWTDYETFMLVPLVGKRVQAGFLSNWDTDRDTFEEVLPKVPWEVDKEYKGRYLTFEVTGESMESEDEPYDSLFEGDLILCREVQRHLWQSGLHIHKWDFVIAHKTDGLLVKRIVAQDLSTGKLVLRSLNPRFPDQKVYMDDLIAVFNVIDVKRSRRRR